MRDHFASNGVFRARLRLPTYALVGDPPAHDESPGSSFSGAVRGFPTQRCAFSRPEDTWGESQERTERASPRPTIRYDRRAAARGPGADPRRIRPAADVLTACSTARLLL